MQILQINSSLFGEEGQSSRLADAYVARARKRHPGASLVRRNLADESVPHLDAETFQAFAIDPDQRDGSVEASVRDQVAFSDQLIAELTGSDLLVLGVPMYNFGVPSKLKAWIDHVARAGVTFRYTETGPEGLVTGTRAVVAAASGGFHAGGETDSLTPYLRTFLGFLGISQVEWIRAEGLTMGEESAQTALDRAHGQIRAAA